MTKIAVIGLGAMGAALAREQLKGGHSVTVWNRTPAKAEPFVAKGATLAATAAEAARVAQIALICVDTYASAEAALGEVWQPDGLAGRIVVQLGTGSPSEARHFAEKVEVAGGQALDGAIMCYPDSVGPNSEELIMIGGPEPAFRAAETALRLLTGNLQYLGDNIAAPATLDTAMLSISIPLYAGIAYAARLCEAEGVAVSDLARLDSHGPAVMNRLEVIAADAFPLGSLHDGGSLAVWTDVAEGLARHARELGINSEIPDFMAELYRRAVDAGHGPEDVTALVKLLRDI
ncbi:MAG: NAD(P)-binding domain-containing protein [Paracoccaceae bacterium]|nr:NAD(P)-binding domain-containing protein [Paracoccaceae bacterium]